LCEGESVLVAIVVLSVLLVGVTSLLVITRQQLARAEHEVQRLTELARRHGRSQPRRERRAQRVKAVVETAVETAALVRDHGVSGLLMASMEDFSRWTQEDRNEIAKLAGPDGAVTIMFSDIENSTHLNETLGDKQWVKVLSAHDKVVHDRVSAFGGHIVKSQGDGFMMAFREPAAAVRAGIEIQDAIEESGDRRLRRTPIRVRVGIHCGTAIERDGDLFGRNVAMAARVASQARGGEILVSDDIRVALKDVEDVVLVDGRDTELKGLPGVHRLWEVAVV
jgi:class 3 adenylate cyclase